MTLKQRNEMQIQIALGDVNRYYFHEHYQRDATSDEELVMYFVEFGAKIFSDLHKEDE